MKGKKVKGGSMLGYVTQRELDVKLQYEIGNYDMNKINPRIANLETRIADIAKLETRITKLEALLKVQIDNIKMNPEKSIGTLRLEMDEKMNKVPASASAGVGGKGKTKTSKINKTKKSKSNK